jgi:hypothetical protein
MEVTGQLDAPVTLSPRKVPTVPIRWEAEWTSLPVWMLWRTEEYSTAGNRNQTVRLYTGWAIPTPHYFCETYFVLVFSSYVSLSSSRSASSLVIFPIKCLYALILFSTRATRPFHFNLPSIFWQGYCDVCGSCGYCWGDTSCLYVFWRCSVDSQVVLAFALSFKKNTGIVPLSGHDCFLPNPFQFIFPQSWDAVFSRLCKSLHSECS